jgi:hypothetical protein
VCFWHDDDWCAQVVETDEGLAPADTRCEECFKPILKGQWREHIFQQEREECQECEDVYVPKGAEPPPPCPDGEHSYGETFEYDCCERCFNLLEAIRRVEEADGCSGSETRPSLGWMFEEVGNRDDGWKHYADEYSRLFPGEPVPDWPLDYSDYEEDLVDEYENFWCEKGDREGVVLGGEG